MSAGTVTGRCQVCRAEARNMLPVVQTETGTVSLLPVCGECFGALWHPDFLLGVTVIVNGRWSSCSAISQSLLDTFMADALSVEKGV